MFTILLGGPENLEHAGRERVNKLKVLFDIS